MLVLEWVVRNAVHGQSQHLQLHQVSVVHGNDRRGGKGGEPVLESVHRGAAAEKPAK